MTAALYPLWKKALMDQTGSDNNSGIVDNATTGPYVVLINTTVGTPYAYSNTHQYYNPAITTPANAVVGGSSGTQRITPTATTVSGIDGVFGSSAVVTFPSISGNRVSALVIYRLNTGGNTTWRLMSFYDTVGGGLPVDPNGGNITVTWNASGIFQLSDARAKHDIDRVGEIGPLGLYTYRYKTPDSDLMVGFIAQEVEKIAPWAVFCVNGYKHVDYEAALAAAVRGT